MEMCVIFRKKATQNFVKYNDYDKDARSLSPVVKHASRHNHKVK